MKDTIRIVIAFGGLGALAIVFGVSTFERRRPQSVDTHFTTTSMSQVTTCINNVKINDWIASLSTDDDRAKEAASELLAVARDSAECRQKVIDDLIRAMNKPDLNLNDRPSFLLWHHGALILGKLKGVESLNMLIDHLDLNDGLFSASMYHQPAVAGVEAMGSVAIPKLRDALLSHKNKHVRLAAALCLFDIGGPDATEALQLALSSESDPCVHRFIELCLQPPTSEVLRQRLLAFNCSN